MVLSQPASATTASSEWPITTSSIESVTTSRETSDARMPSVPMEMPSLTTMLLNSMGVPPEVNLVVKAVVVFAVCLAQSAAFRAMVFQRRVGAQS